MSIPGIDALLDLSHWNVVESFAKVAESGIMAVIHKASQGIVSDPQYHPRVLPARGAGLLWGAYHFGVASVDPIKQADFFLSVAGSPKVLCLDWEWNKADTMTAEQAVQFVECINEKTGHLPMIYTSAAFVTELMMPEAEPILRNCDLWLTGFTREPKLPHVWPRWTIWQYGIAPCPGIQGKVDRDTFEGSAEELKAYFS